MYCFQHSITYFRTEFTTHYKCHPSSGKNWRRRNDCLTVARLSDSVPSYRSTLLNSNIDVISVPILKPNNTTTVSPKLKPNPRYIVRMANASELYTVADIRCEAFYGHPKDPHYYPVRRREIYMAMRDRIETGNRCLVAVDTQPPSDWEPFASNEGLVVGSLDASLHRSNGKRCRFSKTERIPWNLNDNSDDIRMYVSSMAVRKHWQGRGLAQQLLKYVDEMAVVMGVNDIFLHVEWNNKPAVHVYTKNGFEVVGEEGRKVIPKWMHFLAKKEHTLMHKRVVE